MLFVRITSQVTLSLFAAITMMVPVALVYPLHDTMPGVTTLLILMVAVFTTYRLYRVKDPTIRFIFVIALAVLAILPLSALLSAYFGVGNIGKPPLIALILIILGTLAESK